MCTSACNGPIACDTRRSTRRSKRSRFQAHARFGVHSAPWGSIRKQHGCAQHVHCAAAAGPLLSLPLLALTCKATFKLGCICALVVWLVKKDRIPSETPRVLSKLAFNVTIPCMLVTKTAETLARTSGDWRYLMVPVAAMVQVGDLHGCRHHHWRIVRRGTVVPSCFRFCTEYMS